MDRIKQKALEEKKKQEEKEKLKQTAIDLAKNPIDGGQLAIQTGLDLTDKDKDAAVNILENEKAIDDINTKISNNSPLSISERFAQALTQLSPSALALSIGGSKGYEEQQKIAKNKADVLVKAAAVEKTGSITPYQQAALGLRTLELEQNQAREGRLGQHFDWKKGEKNISKREKLVKQYNSDAVVKNLRQSIVAGQSALELIQTNSPLGDKSVRVAIARLIGDVGRLSDFDIQQYTGSMSAARRSHRLLKEAWDGNLPAQDREEFAEFISKVLATKKNQLGVETRTWADRAEKASLGKLKAKEALELLQPTAMVNPKERLKATPTRIQRNKKSGLIVLTYANGQTIEVTPEVARQLTGK